MGAVKREVYKKDKIPLKHMCCLGKNILLHMIMAYTEILQLYLILLIIYLYLSPWDLNIQIINTLRLFIRLLK